MAGMSRRKLRQFILLLCLVPLLFIAIFYAYSVYADSAERSELKDDYSTLNSITYGIMSVNAWRDEIKAIIEHQVTEFELTEEQDSLLHLQLTEMIQNMISKADSAIKADDDDLKGKLRRAAVGIFINTDNLKEKAPQFSRSIIDEVMKEENKERLKNLALSKVDEFAEDTYDEDADSLEIKNIYQKYGVSFSKDQDIDVLLIDRALQLEEKNYRESFYILIVVLIYLLAWIVAFKYYELRKPLFFLSVALALTVLATGLTTAMIEIDARISTVDFVLLGEHIEFRDQVIFYRSKSIVELVLILLETRKVDSVLVGVLVLAFSIILPVAKLISTEIYLLGRENLRNNKLVQWLAFKSGKWSMADVMVIAIFMAFVGFDGILDDQLDAMNVKTDSLTTIATNLTSLQPGFNLFLAFVIFSLILSTILKTITARQNRKKAI